MSVAHFVLSLLVRCRLVLSGRLGQACVWPMCARFLDQGCYCCDHRDESNNDVPLDGIFEKTLVWYNDRQQKTRWLQISGSLDIHRIDTHVKVDRVHRRSTVRFTNNPMAKRTKVNWALWASIRTLSAHTHSGAGGLLHPSTLALHFQTAPSAPVSAPTNATASIIGSTHRFGGIRTGNRRSQRFDIESRQSVLRRLLLVESGAGGRDGVDVHVRGDKVWGGMHWGHFDG